MPPVFAIIFAILLRHYATRLCRRRLATRQITRMHDMLRTFIYALHACLVSIWVHTSAAPYCAPLSMRYTATSFLLGEIIRRHYRFSGAFRALIHAASWLERCRLITERCFITLICHAKRLAIRHIINSVIDRLRALAAMPIALLRASPYCFEILAP